jgi:hypothetical protein
MRVKPVAANAKGKAFFMPKISTEVSTFVTSLKTSGENSTLLNVSLALLRLASDPDAPSV